MSFRKRISVLVLLALSISMIASQSGFAQGPKNPADIRLSWIGKTLNNPWWISVADFSQVEAKELGVQLTIAMPEEEVDLEKQITMIEAAVEQKVDAILISASSSDGVIPAIEKAREAGIVIINFDTRISDPAYYDAFVGADDVAGAYKAGKYICETLGEQGGEVGLLEGLLAQSTGVDRKAGFEQGIADCPYPVEIVASQGAQWRSDLALDATVNMLTAHPNIKAMFASNDQMAVGMVNGVYAAGKDPKDLILVGYDGILDAAKMVLSGDLDAFVALPNREEGFMAPRLAVAKILNPEYQFEREIIFPGPLVTQELIPGLTDETIYEYMARVFPLYGVTDKGY
jgi:ribose transport system substrate-binding protein